MRVYWRIYNTDARTVILVMYVNTILSFKEICAFLLTFPTRCDRRSLLRYYIVSTGKYVVTDTAEVVASSYLGLSSTI
jgi:hypothetical protein